MRYLRVYGGYFITTFLQEQSITFEFLAVRSEVCKRLAVGSRFRAEFNRFAKVIIIFIRIDVRLFKLDGKRIEIQVRSLFAYDPSNVFERGILNIAGALTDTEIVAADFKNGKSDRSYDIYIRIFADIYAEHFAFTHVNHRNGCRFRGSQQIPHLFGYRNRHIAFPCTAVAAEFSRIVIAVHLDTEQLISAADIRARINPTLFLHFGLTGQHPMRCRAEFKYFRVGSLRFITIRFAPCHVIES